MNMGLCYNRRYVNGLGIRMPRPDIPGEEDDKWDIKSTGRQWRQPV